MFPPVLIVGAVLPHPPAQDVNVMVSAGTSTLCFLQIVGDFLQVVTSTHTVCCKDMYYKSELYILCNCLFEI
jgi:hypothetical protein